MLKKILSKFINKFNQLIVPWNHSGKWIIEIRKIETKEIINTIVAYNQITNTAKDEMIKVFQGDYSDLDIKELAIGTGATAPSQTDTELGNEVYRITVDENSRTDTGVNTTTFTLNGSQYTGGFTEIGLFAGWTADPWSGGIGKNTGKLISKVLIDEITIDADEEVYFQRIDTIN